MTVKMSWQLGIKSQMQRKPTPQLACKGVRCQDETCTFSASSERRPEYAIMVYVVMHTTAASVNISLCSLVKRLTCANGIHPVVEEVSELCR